MEPLPESVHPDWPLPFVPQDWEHTPAAVQAYVHTLQDELTQLRARVEALEARLTQNSTTSHRPPSSDLPSKKPRQRPGKRVGNRAIRAIARRLYLPRRSTRCVPSGVRVATRRVPCPGHTTPIRCWRCPRSRWR
jgi:transposase